MNMNAMLVCKLNPLSHIIMAEVLCLGAKPKGVTTDIHGICSMINGRDTTFQVLGRSQ